MNRIYTVGNFQTETEKREFVEKCDLDFETRMQETVESVAQTPNLRLLGLTGPTCSGKTTAAKRLTDCLEKHGRRVHVISIDDFYFDKTYLNKRAANDPDIEVDFDSEETIDMNCLNSCLSSLMENRETKMPRFDFRIGQRTDGVCITPKKEDVFLVEGIQVLYPKVHEILKKGVYECIYIYPQSAIEIAGQTFFSDEIRLLRRLVRDYYFRASSPEFTLYLWQSVRENENKNIFPHAGNCDMFIDSTLPYEIGMLKPYLEEILPKIPKDNVFYEKGMEILNRISQISPISSSFLRPNSLYKEFLR